MANILVLHGPNLNLLGKREVSIYGTLTLDEINHELAEHATELGHRLEIFQSNGENELINAIHKAKEDDVHFIIINPGALTHTSIALRDALLAVELPFLEVHISNIYGRETFREKSYLSDVAMGVIVGLGPMGYQLALVAAHHLLA